MARSFYKRLKLTLYINRFDRSLKLNETVENLL